MGRLPMVVSSVTDPMPKSTTITLRLRRVPEPPVVSLIRQHILLTSPFVDKEEIPDGVELCPRWPIHCLQRPQCISEHEQDPRLLLRSRRPVYHSRLWMRWAEGHALLRRRGTVERPARRRWRGVPGWRGGKVGVIY
jgi:hypothetical protein